MTLVPTPQEVIGMMVVFGIAFIAILVMLKRIGVIKFGNSVQCSDHSSFCNSFKILKDEHIIYGEAIKQHEEKLKEGKTDFVVIKDDIGEIKTNVALIKQKLGIDEG